MKRDNTRPSGHYRAMYQLIYESGKISKQEIAKQMDLSLPTVTQTLHQLMQDEQIVTDGKFSSTVGRRAVVYSPNNERAYAIGLELFANHVTATLVNVMYEDLASATINLPFTIELGYFQQLGDWIRDFIQAQKIPLEKIQGVGIGIQGLISSDGKTVLYGKILNCTGLTNGQFERAFGLPVKLFHDADCVALAEQTLSHNHEDATYLSIGEHLGTAIVINDRIYTGEKGRSGTMEHITLNTQNGHKCYCGRRGCLETYSSLSALLKANETIQSFMDRLAKDDKETVQRWRNYLTNLAEVINNLHMFVDNRLVIAGELVRYLDDSAIEFINDRIKEITAFPEDQPYVERGTVQSRAVSFGATLPIIKSVLDNI
ncbi:ROK family protein [Secundilactobacillus hailunensis]|uniref:ROK family protein n=1 Tax=Secundilactobacillus hailunensis TaxID=2559923 RepID=A0ABW1T7J0_9LACO|nr:ROK family transcriptional regulator [Secundilactobacillus hailunensis]